MTAGVSVAKGVVAVDPFTNQTYTNPTFTGVAQFANGTVGAPSIAWTSEPTTGMYRGGSGQLNFTVAGVEQFRAIGSGTLFTNPIFNNKYVRTTAPNTQTGTTYTVLDTDSYLIANGSATLTLTLPSAASYTGRVLRVKTTAAFTVVSNASNVVPLAGGAASTAILAATAGKWADLVSDGSNWIIMAAN